MGGELFNIVYQMVNIINISLTCNTSVEVKTRANPKNSIKFNYLFIN